VLSVTPDDDGGSDGLWEKEWADHHYRLAMGTVRATFEDRSVQVFDRLLAGDSVRDAAQAFGTSEQAVRKIKQRIRNRLRELIDQQVRDEDQLRWPAAGIGDLIGPDS
jgi:DNA-directed RNA polymerase specialized sigma24 family protein